MILKNIIYGFIVVDQLNIFIFIAQHPKTEMDGI